MLLRAHVPSSFKLRMVRAVFLIATYQVLRSGDLYLYAKLQFYTNRPEIFRGVREGPTTWKSDHRFLKNGPQVILSTFLCRTFKSTRYFFLTKSAVTQPVIGVKTKTLVSSNPQTVG